MGTHRAAPGPGPCQTPSVPPPLCLLFPHPAVSVRLCACLSVPHPSSPGHCLHLCPPWGVPYPCAPMKVAALGWEHPMADPRSGAGLTSRPPPWGDAGVALGSLPYPHHQPCQPGLGGAPGCSALPLPKRLRPLCASVSPFLLGGTRCHCLPSALRPTCPGACPHRGRAAGPPPSPALLKGRGTSHIYVIPQTLFKDPDKVYFIYLFSLVCGGTRPARLVLCNKHFGEISPRLRLVGVHKEGGGPRPSTALLCSDCSISWRGLGTARTCLAFGEGRVLQWGCTCYLQGINTALLAQGCRHLHSLFSGQYSNAFLQGDTRTSVPALSPPPRTWGHQCLPHGAAEGPYSLSWWRRCSAHQPSLAGAHLVDAEGQTPGGHMAALPQLQPLLAQHLAVPPRTAATRPAVLILLAPCSFEGGGNNKERGYMLKSPSPMQVQWAQSRSASCVLQQGLR